MEKHHVYTESARDLPSRELGDELIFHFVSIIFGNRLEHTMLSINLCWR